MLPCLSQQAGFVCYQPLNPAFCPTAEIPNCNGLEAIGAICEGDSGPQCDFNGDLDNCPALDGDDAYVRVRCPGASKSAKSSEFPGILPTGTFPAMQQQQHEASTQNIGLIDNMLQAAGKSAKSESLGEWSKSAKSEWEGLSKSAKSLWEGIGEWSKSSKSEWEGLSKSAKSQETAAVTTVVTAAENVQQQGEQQQGEKELEPQPTSKPTKVRS